MPSDFDARVVQGYLSTHYIRFMAKTPEEWTWVLDRIELNFGGVLSALPRESRILDAPCGVGYLEHYLLKRGFQNIDGVDLAEEQLNMAKQKLLESGLSFDGKARLILANLFEFLQKVEPYDVIAVIDFLEHLRKDQVGDLLTLAHSALRPGGILLLRATNADNLLFSRYFYRDFTHEIGFTPESIRQCLEIARFNVEKIDYEKVGDTDRSLAAWVRRKIRAAGLRMLARLLGISHESFTEDLIAVARK